MDAAEMDDSEGVAGAVEASPLAESVGPASPADGAAARPASPADVFKRSAVLTALDLTFDAVMASAEGKGDDISDVDKLFENIHKEMNKTAICSHPASAVQGAGDKPIAAIIDMWKKGRGGGVLAAV